LGELFFIVKQSRNGLSETAFRLVLSRILHSYKVLHDLGFTHNDIKPENIVLDRALHCKVIDFG